MAKSQRSNRQKALRRARAQALKCTWQEEADKRRQEALAKCMAADPEPVRETVASDPEHAEVAMAEDTRGRTGGRSKGSGSAKLRSAANKAGEEGAAGESKADEDGMDLDEALNSRIQQKLHKLKGVQKRRGGERKRQVGALHAFEAAKKDSKGRKKKGRKTLDEIRYML